MNKIKNATAILARFLLSIIFIASAVNQLFHWHETELQVSSVLCDWQIRLHMFAGMQQCLAMFVDWTPFLLIITTLLSLIGGLLLLVGVKEKLGAGLLIVFLVPVTILMHSFWFFEGSVREQEQIHFLKNMAILGGLILVLLQGAQAPSNQRDF